MRKILNVREMVKSPMMRGLERRLALNAELRKMGIGVFIASHIPSGKESR